MRVFFSVVVVVASSSGSRALIGFRSRLEVCPFEFDETSIFNCFCLFAVLE